MCLSVIYLDNKDSGKKIMEEAAQVVVCDNSLEISTLFGEKRKVDGYDIGEINLLEHYIVLQPKGAH